MASALTRRLAARWLILAALAGILAAGCGDAPATTIDAGAPAVQVPPQAIWPAAEEAALERARVAADLGRRPELLDPEAAARAYLTTGLPPEADATGGPGLRLGRFTSAGGDAGEITASGPQISPTTVSLRRWDGSASVPSRPIWYVQGAGSAALAVIDPDRDGTQLSGSLVPTAAGWVMIRVTGPDGRELARRRVPAQPHRLVDLTTPLSGAGVVVVTAVLVADDGTVALRAFRFDPPA
jgi:hypothetical protein